MRGCMSRAAVRALLVAAVGTAVESAHAQTATLPDSAVWSPRTFEMTAGLLTARAPFDNDGSLGLTAQVSQRRSPHIRWAVQAGGAWNPDLSSCSDGCNRGVPNQLYLSPLIGTGVRSRTIEVRAFVGPRLSLFNEPSRLGGQVTTDISLGNRLGALYVPITWSWNRFDGRTLQQRRIGIGFQNR